MKWTVEVKTNNAGGRQVIQGTNLEQICRQMATVEFCSFEILNSIGSPASWQTVIEKKVAEFRQQAQVA